MNVRKIASLIALTAALGGLCVRQAAATAAGASAAARGDNSQNLAVARQREQLEWERDATLALRQGRIRKDRYGRWVSTQPTPRLVGATAQAAQASAAGGGYAYIPSASEADGRFLAVAGPGYSTLAGFTTRFELSVPSDATEFQFGIFDGETGGRWDQGTSQSVYTLYADPNGDGTGEMIVGQWFGSEMADNGWFDIDFPTFPEAQAPSGNYFFTLQIQQEDPYAAAWNSYKVRANCGLTVKAGLLGISPTYLTADDRAALYPAYPALSPTTYDGTFQINLDVPTSTSAVEVWDGDFDHGNYDGTDLDTNDPDTAPTVPAFANASYTGQERAAAASPLDDNKFALYRRSPAVRYSLVDPNGVEYVNANPSGDTEWERFRVDTAAFNAATMDYHAASLPAGTYQLRISGLDLSNLASIYTTRDVVAVDSSGTPVLPYRRLVIGDVVFQDNNGNGLKEAGEPGLAGVSVSLLDTAGKTLNTTTTNASGQYLFEVAPQQYTVQVNGSNFAAGGALANLALTTASNTLTRTATTANVLDADFGYRSLAPQAAPAEIGSRVWHDQNGNGIQDANEPGVDGATVRLYQGSTLAATTTTSGGGNYTFTNLTAGTYSVEFTAPAGSAYLFTPANQGNDDELDSDADPSTRRASVTVEAGELNFSVAAGLYLPVTLGGCLWFDFDGNGAKASSEPLLPGVSVELRNASGATVATATTGSNGVYSFTGRIPASYKVVVNTATLPAGLTAPTYDFDGVATASNTSVTLASGAGSNNLHFGYRGTGTAGGVVWFDQNTNGVKTGQEPGFGSVTVTLALDWNNDNVTDFTATTATNAPGFYSVANLPAGKYTVRISTGSLPAGSTPTYDPDGTATANVATVTLAAGGTQSALNFGYKGANTVGDLVFYDPNTNGVPNAAGINGVTMILEGDFNNDGVIDYTTSTVTAKVGTVEGTYTFTNLPAGRYTIRVDTATLPLDRKVPTYDLDSGLVKPDNKATFTLTAGQTRLDVDFGYKKN